jgi:hypothetical protein
MTVETPLAAGTPAELSVERLLEQARQACGLSDFGDPWFLEPLDRLVSAINAEARLKSLEGGPVERIVYALQDRLRQVELLKAHPEILDEQVQVAGAILGLPRTGSTMLQRLLGSSPQLTSPYWWEVSFPLPFPGETMGDPTPRKDAAKAAVEAFYAAWPDFRTIHPMDALAHDEEVILLDKSFLSSTYDSILNIPSYGFWMAQADHTPAYEELKVWLQILQWQAPERRGRKWVLKTPHHLLGGLSGLLNVFPDCRVVMTHRAVAETLPSYCSMCASMTSAGAHAFDLEAVGTYWTRRFQDGLRALIAVRRHEPASRFIDVRYRDLLDDPVGEAERVMQRMGLEPDARDVAAMAAWLAANGREKRPPHRYTLEMFGLSPEGLERDFAFYQDAYVR